ncbi:axonemal dynein light chain domain-containing protein 1 isoform X3 [Heterodontus francisci]|uniref:axonemal dynein light chain domain-containing protein 1 isoform X3 n=1 Tax=Heterodontus francisci TaxID=7792 RepID=UPI00355B723A
MCDAVHEDVSPVVPNPNKDSSELTSNVCIDLKEQPESTPTSEQMLNICACFGERAKSGESDQSDSDTCMHLKEQTELHKQKNMPHAIDQHPTTSLQNDFIPEEILLALTTVTNSCCHDEPLGPLKKNRTPKDPKGYRTKLHRIRPTDHVWHHPTRRTRFKYLIDQPVSLAQAGRDISFLCDAVYSKCPEQLVPAISITRDKSAVRAQLEKQHATKELDVPESLIPDEYHIVKNKGVLGLEYYDDKYTTLLQDREKKLRIFPSMKPSGRVEAIQLSQVMDAMLEKVGFNEDNEPKLKGETQMHHLLDLVKKEQDIYNIVFHELIRQISVDCAERGELLAKIREKYVNLLDYIPRQLSSMHNEIMMQRLLDKQLIMELFVFQNAVEKLNSELGELRERDRKATKIIDKTQEELSNALIDAQKNANMLDEYHHLYELQRKRLIAQVGALTQEKDWWSEAAYSLALKVIEEKNLKLVHDLEVCEKLWVKIAQHFADAEDQTKLQEITAHWREQIIKFNKNIEHAENSSLEKRELILSGFKKWHKYFSEKIASPRGIKSFPKDMLYMLRNDLKDWHELITQDYERYEGSLFSTTQEALFDIVQLHNDWIDLSLTLFERHQWSMDEKIPEQIAMEELSSTVGTLSQHYTIMLTGENGIIEIILCTAWHLMKLQDMLESCRVKFDFANMEEIGSVEFDLLKLHEKFPTLIKLLEDAMNLAATPQTEEEKMNKQPYVSSSLQLGEVIHKMQDWLLTLFKMITHKDTKLTQQIAIIQSAMSHLLVDLLLYMVLDPAANTRKTYFKHLSTPDTPAKLEEKALMVASELNILSTQMYRWCKDIVEALVKQRAAMHLHDPDNELKELEKLKVECTEWINICEILLSEIKQQPVQLLSARNENVLSQINLTRDLCTACLRGSATNILGMTDSELSVLLPEESQSVDGPTTISSFQRLMTTEVTETAESVTVQVAEDVTETGQSSQLLKSTENTDGADGIKDVEDHSLLMEKGQAFQSHSKAILKYIGDDTNIHERDLKETTVPIAKVNIDAVVPTNPKSVKAYEELTSMGMLQQQLIETELRALNAEERATSLDDSLQEALDKIKDLTLELQTKEAKDELQQPEKSSLPTRTISARSVVKVAKPTSAKTKSTKSTRAKIKK